MRRLTSTQPARGLASLAGLLLAAMLCSACPKQGAGSSSPPTDDSGRHAIQATLVSDVVKAQGMHCGACEMAIETSLYALPGVQSVDADFKTTEVVVEYDAQLNSHADVVAAIEKLGYTVEEVDSATGEAGLDTDPAAEDPPPAAGTESSEGSAYPDPVGSA